MINYYFIFRDRQLCVIKNHYQHHHCLHQLLYDQQKFYETLLNLKVKIANFVQSCFIVMLFKLHFSIWFTFLACINCTFIFWASDPSTPSIFFQVRSWICPYGKTISKTNSWNAIWFTAINCKIIYPLTRVFNVYQYLQA